MARSRLDLRWSVRRLDGGLIYDRLRRASCRFTQWGERRPVGVRPAVAQRTAGLTGMVFLALWKINLSDSK